MLQTRRDERALSALPSNAPPRTMSSSTIACGRTAMSSSTYFGVLPIEASSGIDREGQPRASRRYVMSKRGNDLVRRYLWMAALSAVQCNPAARALYRRVAAKHQEHKAIASGHAMRKLLHLAFEVWKTGKQFDANHYPR